MPSSQILWFHLWRAGDFKYRHLHMFASVLSEKSWSKQHRMSQKIFVALVALVAVLAVVLGRPSSGGKLALQARRQYRIWFVFQRVRTLRWCANFLRLEDIAGRCCRGGDTIRRRGSVTSSNLGGATETEIISWRRRRAWAFVQVSDFLGRIRTLLHDFSVLSGVWKGAAQSRSQY